MSGRLRYSYRAALAMALARARAKKTRQRRRQYAAHSRFRLRATLEGGDTDPSYESRNMWMPPETGHLYVYMKAASIRNATSWPGCIWSSPCERRSSETSSRTWVGTDDRSSPSGEMTPISSLIGRNLRRNNTISAPPFRR